MKKMLFVVLAVSAGLLILSGIYAQDTPQSKVEESKIEKKSETPKIDPNKKYKIKFDFVKDMSFTRTEKASFKRIVTLQKKGDSKPRILRKQEKQNTEKLQYTILELDNELPTRLKIGFPEFRMKMYRDDTFSAIFEEVDEDPTIEWMITKLNNKNLWELQEFSDKLGNIIADEKSIYNAKVGQIPAGRGRPPGIEDLLRNKTVDFGFEYYRRIQKFTVPNHFYTQIKASETSIIDFIPIEPVAVGDSWTVDLWKFYNFTGIEKEPTEFTLEYPIVAKLEKVYNENDSVIAYITFKRTEDNNPLKSVYDKNPTKEKSKRTYTGFALFNLSTNRIQKVSMQIQFVHKLNIDDCGLYIRSYDREFTYEYKYDE